MFDTFTKTVLFGFTCFTLGIMMGILSAMAAHDKEYFICLEAIKMLVGRRS